MTHGDLATYVVRRLLAVAVLLVALSFVVFSLLYLAPGDVIDTLLGTRPRTPETVQALREQYGLDESFLAQYWQWLQSAAQFDFGSSVHTSRPVTEEIAARLPLSIGLAIYGYLLTIVVGGTLGVVAALRKQGLLDRSVVATTIVGLSTPAFVSGFFLLYLFAVLLPWFPTFGRGSGFVDEVWHLTLPAIALAFTCVAFVVKHLRATLINVLDQDYITFARARGLSNDRVLFVYCLRNALIPIVTISAPLLAYMITGAVFVEVTFSLPGMGDLLVQSAIAKDMPVVQGIAIVLAVIIMLMNLVTDVLYAFVDPRIRLEAEVA